MNTTLNTNSISVKDKQTINNFIKFQTNHINDNNKWYHDSYITGFNILFNTPFSLTDFSNKLKNINWEFKFVDGYLSSFEYFKCLGNQVLPIINKVRDNDHLLYADFPDMIHDMIGHAPMLFSNKYTNFLNKIYILIDSIERTDIDIEYMSLQGVTKEEREKNMDAINKIDKFLQKEPTLFYEINTMALWTVEFGILEYNSSYQAYGAAVVGSPLEMNNLILNHIPIKKLNPNAKDKVSFNFSTFQEALYSTQKIEDVLDLMESMKK
tara:strand:+ start:1634 stop:2434 length:801 start_codon:yes stop_codon:yes gene_type:complete